MKIFWVIIFFAATSYAVTLKSLAQKSNALLVMAENVALNKKPHCGYDMAQVSELSQNLKADVDAKVSSLTAADLEIIKSRIPTCQIDCTCDIYALALEHHQQASEPLNQKAAQVKMTDRAKCSKIFKNICKLK